MSYTPDILFNLFLAIGGALIALVGVARVGQLLQARHKWQTREEHYKKKN